MWWPTLWPARGRRQRMADLPDLPAPSFATLLVEDDPIVAMAIGDALTALGAVPLVIGTSADEALVLIDGQHFAAALVDVSLGAGGAAGGIAVADRLARSATPFAFVTGDAAQIPPRHAARPVLAKPFGLDSLEKIWHSLLGQPLSA